MNLKTGILLILFCVLLGGIVVGQRLQIRSVAFDAGQHERELRETEKRNLVLRVQRSRKADPSQMMQRVREAGISLLPPEQKEAPKAEADKGKTKEGKG